MSKVRFSFLTGDVNWSEYGGKWISQKLYDGARDYWLVKELVNMDDACGRDNEGKPKYHCSLAEVRIDDPDLEAALSCCGIEDEAEEVSVRDKVEAIQSYSGGMIIWQESGNNYSKLFAECQSQANSWI
jgi:hypothetical protein